MERSPLSAIPAIPAIPEATRRLFPGYADADLSDPARGRSLLISRLLEDGDSADLAWLCRAIPEEELGSWLESRGGRQLSVRSRAFWEVVLGREAKTILERNPLWPL